MMKKIIVAVAFVVIGTFIFTMKREPERLPNGTTYIKSDGAVFEIRYVRDRDGQLVYAFVVDEDVPVISTSDPS